MPSSTCEACHRNAVEYEFTDDETQQPYCVCGACRHRLKNYSLRPLEWFNLAAKHGPSRFLLHDDFYDEDGTACQPSEEVVDARLFPAPTLDDVARDLPRLIDYCITRWQLDDATVTAVGQYSPDQVLGEMVRRASEPAIIDIVATCYAICARAMRAGAAQWIREQFNKYPQLLFCWAEAAASCLNPDEGFELTIATVNRSGEKSLQGDSQSLCWFRTERTLDWIESRMADPRATVPFGWGRLAAVSQLSWARVLKWLRYGRPLSLIALDALRACWHYDTPILRQMQPKLIGAPEKEAAFRELEQLRLRDPAPRVANAVGSTIAHWNEIA